MRFGEFIEAARKRAGISANQMARLLGFSLPYLRDVELCKCSPFADKDDRYGKLAVLLSVERVELLERAITERGEFVVSVKGWDAKRIRALIELVSVLEPRADGGSSLVLRKLFALVGVQSEDA